MADIDKAAHHILDHYRFNAGAFYGQAEHVSLGVGLIYDGLQFPLFDEDERVFITTEGLCYVLTHECDVDPTNERHFNEYVLICPINRFEVFVTDFCATYSEGALYGMLPDIAQDNVYRVCYFPPITDFLPYGGLLYLNHICSTHVSEFVSGEARKVCALSSYALEVVDRKVENHLLRPKAEDLPRLM